MTLRNDLISREYLEQNRILHRGKEGFGGSGWKHVEAIHDFYNEIDARSALDYGAGECTLLRDIKKLEYRIKLAMYDPAVPKISTLPRAADLVICTDVLEHVELERLNAVLLHINALARIGVYLVIATRAANKTLPNGKNAHAIIEDTPWWDERIKIMRNFVVMRRLDVRKGGVPTGAPHDVRYWLIRK